MIILFESMNFTLNIEFIIFNVSIFMVFVHIRSVRAASALSSKRSDNRRRMRIVTTTAVCAGARRSRRFRGEWEHATHSVLQIYLNP